MKEAHRILIRILDTTQLEADIKPGVSILEMINNERLLIEKHKSVIGYTADKIVISMLYGQLYVSGQGLHLAKLGRDQLVINGKIQSITVQSRGE